MSQKCPPDIGEQAEKYHLGMLLPQEAAALEEHYLGCAACTAELERAEEYVAAMRSAAKRIVKPETQASAAGRP